jgi:hypothetical protein
VKSKRKKVEHFKVKIIVSPNAPGVAVRFIEISLGYFPVQANFYMHLKK